MGVHIIKIKVVQVGGRHLRVSFFGNYINVIFVICNDIQRGSDAKPFDRNIEPIWTVK